MANIEKINDLMKDWQPDEEEINKTIKVLERLNPNEAASRGLAIGTLRSLKKREAIAAALKLTDEEAGWYEAAIEGLGEKGGKDATEKDILDEIEILLQDMEDDPRYKENCDELRSLRSKLTGRSDN